jgi:hypothetical protein
MTEPLFSDNALQELQRNLDRHDHGASSHWRQMHQDYRYRDGRFEGLNGFGDPEPAGAWPRRLVHRWLQRPFRRIGRGLGDFRTLDGIGARIAAIQERAYNLDILRQVLTVAWLSERLGPDFARLRTILVIGDGFGTLTSLLRSACPAARIVMVNLTKTLLVDWLYVARLDPGIRMCLAPDAEALDRALADAGVSVIAIQADDAGLLAKVEVDLAINIASMQEMGPETVGLYFDTLRARRDGRQSLFYCCNREEKRLPDGTVSRFSDYPWRANDTLLVDELCPWHQEYYIVHPPSYRPYEGPHRHRLVRLVTDAPSSSPYGDIHGGTVDRGNYAGSR